MHEANIKLLFEALTYVAVSLAVVSFVCGGESKQIRRFGYCVFSILVATIILRIALAYIKTQL